MIKVIVFGKIKEKYLSDLINDYLNRVKKYQKVDLIELKDDNNIKVEALSIKKHLKNQDYKIALDINGEKMDSIGFAKFLNNTFSVASTITFIIGGSNGIDEDIKKICDYRLSFSDFTLPHGLFRGVLLEQIYRAIKINNNETYHK